MITGGMAIILAGATFALFCVSVWGYGKFLEKYDERNDGDDNDANDATL